MNVKVIKLPKGTDPADCISQSGENFKTLVKNAVPTVSFMLEHIKETHGSSGEDVIRGVLEEMVPLLRSMRDPLVREYAIKESADACSVSKEVIEELLGAQPEKQEERIQHPQKNTGLEQSGLKKIDELYIEVARARSFLENKDVPLKGEVCDILQYIESKKKLPGVHDGSVNIQYEEKFPDEKDRAFRVQEELRSTVKTLYLHLKKQEALGSLIEGALPKQDSLETEK